LKNANPARIECDWQTAKPFYRFAKWQKSNNAATAVVGVIGMPITKDKSLPA
jgi:hypothetical protein